MKFCPNADCRHSLETGAGTEFGNADKVCPACGTPLVDEQPRFTLAEDEDEFDPEKGWVAVTNPLLSIEAQLLRDRLVAQGITAHVTDDTVSSFFILTTFGGAHVMVREQDVALALKILGQAA